MRMPWSPVVLQSTRFWARNMEAVFLVAFCLGTLLTRPATAAWRMTVQSRTVTVGEMGVTVTLTYSWDIALNAVVLPIVVRSTRNWAFWTGNLPYDTTDLEGNRFTQGVTWDPNVASWSGIIREMRPNPSSYDSSPSVDNFVITNHGVGNLAAKQNGAPWVTIQFDVNNWPGEFEFVRGGRPRLPREARLAHGDVRQPPPRTCIKRNGFLRIALVLGCENSRYKLLFT